MPGCEIGGVGGRIKDIRYFFSCSFHFHRKVRRSSYSGVQNDCEKENHQEIAKLPIKLLKS